MNGNTKQKNARIDARIAQSLALAAQEERDLSAADPSQKFGSERTTGWSWEGIAPKDDERHSRLRLNTKGPITDLNFKKRLRVIANRADVSNLLQRIIEGDDQPEIVLEAAIAWHRMILANLEEMQERFERGEGRDGPRY